MKNLCLTVLLFLIFFHVFNQASEAYYQNNGSCDYNQLQYYQAQYDKALNDYQTTLNSDPRLQNQGYYVDPEAIIRAADTDALKAAIYGGNGIRQGLTPQQRAQIRYEAQIANKYGVPYQEYMNAQRQRIANQLEIQQQMINNYKELINQCMRNMRY